MQKFADTFHKFINWLVLSSANPTEASVTVKGLLGGFATVLITISPLLHLNLGADAVNNTVDLLVQIFTTILGIVSALAFLAGLARKVYITWFYPSDQA